MLFMGRRVHHRLAADRYVFPSFLIEKGKKKHRIWWYQNDNAEGKMRNNFRGIDFC